MVEEKYCPCYSQGEEIVCALTERQRGLLVTARLHWKLRSNVNKINIYKFDSFTQMPYNISEISYTRR